MHTRFFARTAVASLMALAISTSACSGRPPTGPDPLPEIVRGVTAGRVLATPAATLTAVSVTFVSQGASANGRPLTFTWDFGDGETATGETTSHAYPRVGDFVVKLTVNDDSGNSATASSTVTVKDLSGQWAGEASGSNPLYGGHTVVTIVQDGLKLTGTYRDDSTSPGTIAGTIDKAGGVVFTVTIPEMVPFTFTGVATVSTLVGVANGSGFDNQPWTLTRFL